MPTELPSQVKPSVRLPPKPSVRAVPLCTDEATAEKLVPKTASEIEFYEWLKGLDHGRGKLLQYFPKPLRLSFFLPVQDISQLHTITI